MNFISNIQGKIAAAVTISMLIGAVTVTAQVPGNAPPQGAVTGQSAKGAVMKGKAPLNKELVKVKLPRAQETILPNGLKIILIEDHKIPTFALQMVVLSGGLSDPSDRPGLASFTASLLREGTASRSAKDISEQMDSFGSTLTGQAGMGTFSTNIQSQGLIEHFDATLDVFSDAIRNPQFPAAEVEKYKLQSTAQNQSLRAIPMALALERMYQANYGTQNWAKVIAPLESIKGLSSEQLKQFHQTYYRPNNSILVVAGDISMKELLPRINRAFGDWQKGDVPTTPVPEVSPAAKGGISLIDRPGSVQTTLYLSNLSLKRTDEDYYALAVMNQILGGGASSRLFMNLREDKGYTYGAYSQAGSGKIRGLLQASAEVRTDVTEGALKEFMYEINRIRDERVSVLDLENAKRGITGHLAFSLEDPQSLISNVLVQKHYNFPANYWDTYSARIAAVTAEDVQRVAQKYFDLPSMQIIAVGDAAKIRDVLAKYGPVKQYTVDGKEVMANSNNSQ